VLTRFAEILGRYTAIFVVGAALNLLLQTANLIVLTQFLPVSEYGRLGLLLIFASFLTIVGNLCTLHGTLLVVFGSSGDEDAGEDFDAFNATTDKRAGLATGLMLTITVVLVLGIVLTPMRWTLAQLITHHRRYGDDVLLAIVSGSAGSVQRLVVNVLRIERRPIQYVFTNLLRPAGAIAISVPLLATGQGARGALLGVIGGTVVSASAAIGLTFRSYSPHFRPKLAALIIRGGAPYIPINLSFWFLHSGDAFVLSRFRSNAQVGLYRLASRLGNISSYYVSAVLMSWSPIKRMSAFRAVDQLQPQRLRSLLLTYLVLSNLMLVLGLSVFAPLILGALTPSSYAGAADLVAPIALAYSLYGLFIMIYRLSEVHGARKLYIAFAVSAALTFVVASILITPALGGLGTAISLNIAYLLPGTLMVSVLQRRRHQPLQYGRWATAAVLAGALYAVVRLAQPEGALLQLAYGLAAVGGFPLALVAVGVVPRAHVRLLAGILSSIFPSRKAVRAANLRLDALEDVDRRLVELSLDRHGSTHQAAAVTGLSRPEVELRVVWALRRVGGLGGPRAMDARTGAFLLSRLPIAERDVMARALWHAGVDPQELDALESVRDTLRRGLRPSSSRRQRRRQRGAR
jgi:O-antigen/teichoic acid export membrane protein